MLETLKEISEPGPASMSEVKEDSVAPAAPNTSALTTPEKEDEVGVAKEEESLGKSRSSEEEVDSNEDEMDEDAVLLKRPRDFEAGEVKSS